MLNASLASPAKIPSAAPLVEPRVTTWLESFADLDGKVQRTHRQLTMRLLVRRAI